MTVIYEKKVFLKMSLKCTYESHYFIYHFIAMPQVSYFYISAGSGAGGFPILKSQVKNEYLKYFGEYSQ